MSNYRSEPMAFYNPAGTNGFDFLEFTTHDPDTLIKQFESMGLTKIGHHQSLSSQGLGLTYIDHVTHNLYRGNMIKWADFYTQLFNFREVRYFDIEGQLTGLKSKAMTSPCGKIRIPLNESSDNQSQIEEFL